ncbi:solute carrier family 22 member 5-like isoform X2 [Amphibalanus amphitrite]|uniref:solute carrier family 22 member 5-like isoform X2 n=1 Tax=Amphibalanus amphitrite TaxID=1232801 RepID=UPI001C90941A|nr:solute carrier family 22 member 5-like isoform X2 [Amphibalanus amphitrite]XP_043238232.1 solute carrier family 22 member 5-like isoform X2 [Amphibalanus amphitrite]
MDVDAILERIGGWGRYQKVLYVLAALPSIVGGMVTLAYSWTAFFMEHRCLVEECEDPSNATYDAPFLRWSTPTDADHTWSRCQRYRPTSVGGCTNTSFFTNQTESCSRWVYDKSVMESTVVSEFNLVCDRETLWPLENSLYFVGVAVGSVLGGALADRYGRRFTLLLCVVLTAAASTAGAFSPNYGTFATLRFFVAVFQYPLFAAPFVLSTEITSVEMRAACGIMMNAFFAIGEALAGVIPIFEKDWSTMQLIFSIPILVFCSYWFFFPESPRWLLTVSQPQKAEDVLRNIARWNKTDFPEDLVAQESKVETATSRPSGTSADFMRVLKSPVLLKRACILSVQWAVVAMVYYGVGLVSTDLAGDVYLNFILTMLIEIPAYIVCSLFINPLGRKLMFVSSFVLSGLGTIGAGLITSNELEWLTTTLALLGKFGASGAFSLAYVYTAELYPDSLRALGVGVASATGRVGSILAPFIADLGQGDTTLPMCIFGVAGLVSAGLTMLLPETSGQDLPTSIDEAIQFGRGQPLLPVPCLVARRQRKREQLRGFDGPQIQLPDTEGDAHDQGHSKTV